MLLRLVAVVAQRNCPFAGEALLLWLDADREIVLREGKGFTIQREGNLDQTTQDTKDAEPPHPHCIRRWRTISYNTTPAATETFSDGTFPSMGIETTKSHFFNTRS